MARARRGYSLWVVLFDRSILCAPEESTTDVTESDVAERKEALDDDVDAILDEIDDVLETNAEDFVKSFIQKGGE